MPIRRQRSNADTKDVLKFFFFVISTLVGVLPGAQSAFAERSYFTVMNYTEGGKFRTGTSRELSQGIDGFRDVIGSPKKMMRDCPLNLMEQDQTFSFQVMRDRGYITPEEFEFYTNVAATLNESQVVFFHEFKSYTREDFARLTPNEIHPLAQSAAASGTVTLRIPNEAMLRGHSVFSKALENAVKNSTADVIVTALYLVRGQGYDRYLPKRHFLMPWQTEKAFLNFAPLDRIQYPLVFELGRAAALKRGAIKNVLRLAIAQMVEDALTYRVPFDKIPVFIHALDQIHIDHYRHEYGFAEFAVDPANRSNQVMMITLAKVLEKFPLESFLDSVASIRRALNGRVTAEGAAKIYRRMSAETFQFVDVRPSEDGQTAPLFLVNELFEAGVFVGEEMFREGINRGAPDLPAFNEVFRALNGRMNPTPFIPPEFVVDRSLNMSLTNAPEKALRIENIDPQLIRRSPDQFIKLLMGVHAYYEKKRDRMRALFGPLLQFSPATYAWVSLEDSLGVGMARLREELGHELIVKKTAAHQAIGFRGLTPNTLLTDEVVQKVSLEAQFGNIQFVYLSEADMRRLHARHPAWVDEARNLLSLGKSQENSALQSPLLR